MKTNTKDDVLPHSQTTKKRDENTIYNTEHILTSIEVFGNVIKQGLET